MHPLHLPYHNHLVQIAITLRLGNPHLEQSQQGAQDPGLLWSDHTFAPAPLMLPLMTGNTDLLIVPLSGCLPHPFPHLCPAASSAFLVPYLVVHGLRKSWTQLSDWTKLNWLSFSHTCSLHQLCLQHPLRFKASCSPAWGGTWDSGSPACMQALYKYAFLLSMYLCSN